MLARRKVVTVVDLPSLRAKRDLALEEHRPEEYGEGE